MYLFTKNNISLEEKFLFISFSIVIWLCFLVFLTILGYFQFWIIFVLSLLEAGFIVYCFAELFYKGLKGLLSFRYLDLFIIAAILFFAITTSIFHHDLPTGRDDFSYLVSAHELAETGKLSFYDMLSRPLHGLRNLGNDVYTSQFLPAYNTYLAVFEVLFGRTGLLWSNAILLFFSLLSFYYIGKNLASRKAGVIAVLIAVTSFVFNWFPRRTNTENLSLFLFWLAVALLLYGVKKKNKNFAILGIIPVTFSMLSRIESLVYLCFYSIALLILFKLNGFDWVKQIKKTTKILVSLAGFLIAIILILYNVLYSSKYIVDQINDFFKLEKGGNSALFLAVIFLIVALVLIYWLVRMPRINLSKNKLNVIYFALVIGFILWAFYVRFQLAQTSISETAFKTIYTYYVFDAALILLLLLFAILLLKRKKLEDYLVFLICAPTFIYLIEPFIAYDLPWFLRRFYPVLIPLTIILASVFLASIKLNRRLKTIVLVLIIFSNIMISQPLFTFVDHRGLFDKISKFSSEFNPTTDFVIGQKFPYEFSRVLSAMHYFFNINAVQSIDEYTPEEIRELISRYQNIYVVFVNQFEEYPYRSDNCEAMKGYGLNFKQFKSTNTSITAYLSARENTSAEYLATVVISDNFFPEEANIKSGDFNICKIKDKNNFSFNIN